MKTTKVRPGLYSVAAGKRIFDIEEVHDGSRWGWRVTEPETFHDGYLGDFDTKREALAMIAGMNSN